MHGIHRTGRNKCKGMEAAKVTFEPNVKSAAQVYTKSSPLTI